MATPSLGFDNFFSTTLSNGISASDTTIPLTNVPTASEGFLVLEPDNATSREIIYYTSKTGSGVVCPSAAAGRGIGGTTATSHAQNAAVKMNVVAEMFEAFQDGSAFNIGAFGAAPFANGWVPTGVTPTSVTASGNRLYDIAIAGVGLSGVVSQGMKLRLTRTVTAPTQCTSLNGSTQYYSKTSPAGMTFTDDFVVSAWVKLNAYGSVNVIASRYNGTSGWEFRVETSGQVTLYGYNASSANYSAIQSYQSIPLNKWVHVAAQLDMSAFTSTTTTSYVMIDGKDVAANSARAGTNPTALVQAGNLEIGSKNGGTTPFNGKIAQVAIYSAKVLQATMLAAMHQTLAGNETSLISAYSFNNTINDLNTSNANNLTANGSAVATNADSPFAGGANASGGYTAGTMEFAEVLATTFSGNTTFTVLVPDGYLIPTSGGVSAVSYSVQSTPLGWPLSTGIRTLGYAQSCIDMAAGGAASDLLPLTTTVHVPAGRRIRVTIFAAGIRNSVSSTAYFSLFEGSTQLAQALVTIGNANWYHHMGGVSAVLTPTTGAHTYKARLDRDSGTATATASTALPAYIIVELID